MAKRKIPCKHRFVFDGSCYTEEPDGRFFSFYTRYDHFVCERCLNDKTVTARRESARMRPAWFPTTRRIT